MHKVHVVFVASDQLGIILSQQCLREAYALGHVSKSNLTQGKQILFLKEPNVAELQQINPKSP